jgi:hypothetical protein
MTRDEFEEWFEHHREDLFDRMSQTPRSLVGWATSFGRIALLVAHEQGGEDDDDSVDSAFGGDDEGGLFGGGDGEA